MTANVHNINQDDVLGGDGAGEDPELSPSEFDAYAEDRHSDAAPKKKGGLLPMIIGILAALSIVGFFGWKIVSPYFTGGGQGTPDREAFAPIPTAMDPVQPQPRQFAPEPPTPKPAPATAAMPAAQAVAGQPATAAADPFASSPATASANEASVAVKVSADKIVIGPTLPASSPAAPVPEKAAAPSAAAPGSAQPQQSTTPQQASAPQVATAQQTATFVENIARIDKRIDNIDAALVALKDTVTKLQSEIQKSRAAAPAKPAAVVAKAPSPKPATDTTVAQKSSSPVGSKRTGGTDKNEGANSDKMAPNELQLQAVLQDRAWFKTKTGETLTVSSGEELRGVGVVKQIDAESGRVVFSNGVVFH